MIAALARVCVCALICFHFLRPLIELSCRSPRVCGIIHKAVTLNYASTIRSLPEREYTGGWQEKKDGRGAKDGRWKQREGRVKRMERMWLKERMMKGVKTGGGAE